MTPRASETVLKFHEAVAGLCIERLRDALSAESQLFDRQLRDKQWDATLETEDLTSTAICLIGIHRAGVALDAIGLDVGKTLRALTDVTRRRAYPGGLGLVMWANAVWEGAPLAELLNRTGLSLERPSELLADLTTMETAWLVSGLLHELKRSPSPVARVALEAVRKELFARYEQESHLFRHASDSAKVTHRLRKYVANFADQIYGVQAMALLALSERDEAARAAAQACARRLVELQGKLGQWWWHYDPRDGNVAQGFPVYAVHQHAMAPMALMSLAAAGGTDDHGAAIDLSHAWISQNELGADLLDRRAGTIWRDIELEEGELSRVARHTRSVLGWKPSDGGMNAKNLKINYETRPYEWAWCLFAGAIAAGGTLDAHLV